jgi:hypothetical protein
MFWSFELNEYERRKKQEDAIGTFERFLLDSGQKIFYSFALELLYYF